MHSYTLYIAVDCGSLSDPGNGTVNAPTTTFMNTVTYNCNTGYTLTGDMTRICQANGTWSGTDPTCESSFSSLYTYLVRPVHENFGVPKFRSGDLNFQSPNHIGRPLKRMVLDNARDLQLYAHATADRHFQGETRKYHAVPEPKFSFFSAPFFQWQATTCSCHVSVTCIQYTHKKHEGGRELASVVHTQ